MFLARFTTIKYTSQILHSSVSLLTFSSQTFDVISSDDKKSNENNTNINEHHVLDQLSVLLPIRHKNTTFHEIHSSELELAQLNNHHETLLSPEDTLRGIFIQKLNGKVAVKRALTTASFNLEVNFDLVAKILNRGKLNGGSMVMLFEWAIEHGNLLDDVSSYNVVLKALGRRKLFDFMMNMLTMMMTKGINPNNETLFIIMDSFVKAKRVSKALHMFGKLEEFGVEHDVDSLKVMLQCLCARSQVTAASALLKKMKHKVQYDGETYNIVIRGWSKFGRVNEIEKVLKLMVEDGFDPDSLTFSYILEGLGRNGQIDSAVKIFENMKEQETCVLNAAIFNSMIFNFISIGDIDECLKYYNDMLRNNCEPNIDTYVSMISAFLKARRVADALELFDEMLGRDIKPNIGTITSFIESLCSYGPPHAAMMIYKKAKDAKCTISVNAYKVLLMRLSRFGKCGMLLKVWDEMEQSGYVSDVEVYEFIINGLCNNGQLENAVVIMEDCLKKGFCPSRLISAKLNNKLLASNKVEMAYKLFLKGAKAYFPRRKMANFIQLPCEVLDLIILMLAISTNGAREIAHISATCKLLRSLVERPHVLREINFKCLAYTEDFTLHHHKKDLLCLCTQIGHLVAKNIFAKALLFDDKWFKQMIADANKEALNLRILCCELLDYHSVVRSFIRYGNVVDIIKMYDPLINYVTSFVGFKVAHRFGILVAIDKMCTEMTTRIREHRSRSRRTTGTATFYPTLLNYQVRGERKKVLDIFDQMFPTKPA